MINVQDERPSKKALLAPVLVFAVLLFAPISQAEVQGLIEQAADTVHLEFQGSPYWDYKIVRLDNGRVQATVPALNQATKVKLQTWKSGNVKKIEIAPGEKSGTDVITFTLAAGVETFDYLTDEPSRLIIDVYPTEKPAVATGNATNPQQKLPAKAAKTAGVLTKLPAKVSASSAGNKDQYAKKGQGNREPASDELLRVEDPEGEILASASALEKGIFDAGDPNYKRLAIRDYEIKEDAIIASKQNIYLPFPILKLQTSLLSEFRKNQPEYVIQEKDTDENKEARLLLTLFKEGRFAVFLKTYEFFTSKYKDSEYDEIVRHLAAEVFYQQWLANKDQKDYLAAKDLYTYLVEKYPKSVLKERTQLLIAFNELERKNGLETIQRFQGFLRKNPESEYRDWAKKALAEGFIVMGKYDEALETYDDLEQNFVDKKSSIEATYREGDVHFAKKDYAKAIESYKSAIGKYPDYQGVFPNAFYNMAESLFWQGQHQKSLENFLSYIRLFPTHPYGGYALTRVGELLDILGADKSRSMGAFLESTFRFQNSEGARIARVRMLSQRMKSMKDKELRRAIEEMTATGKETSLPKVEEFVTLMTAEGYRKRDEYDQAIDYLVKFYQKNPTTLNLNFFSQRIRQNIADLVRQKVNNQDFMGTLDLVNKYKSTWLKNSDRLDIPYMVGESFEQAGVYGESEKIYRNTLSRLNAIKGTAEGKERRVNEYLPTQSEAQLRLASALFQQKQYSDAFDELQKTTPEELQSVEKVERVELAAALQEQRGDRAKAIQSLELLEKSWKDKKELLAPIYYRLARLENAEGQFDKAALHVQKIVKDPLPETATPKQQDLYVQAMQLKGDNLMALSQPLAAVETYLNLLTQFEKKLPLQNVRYQAGRILYDQGDLNGAEKIWNSLDKEKGAMYKRMANEKLDDVKWRKEYKKYIERIPAATSLRGEP